MEGREGKGEWIGRGGRRKYKGLLLRGREGRSGRVRKGRRGRERKEGKGKGGGERDWSDL